MVTPGRKPKKNTKKGQQPPNDRRGATTPSRLRKSMDRQKHDIPCNSNIHIGEKNEHSNLLGRSCSNWLGGD
jgi:hypothetical protein